MNTIVSTGSLRNYLHGQPLIDWLDRYGARWLHRETTPNHLRSLITDIRVRAGCSLADIPVVRSSVDECPPAGFSPFHQWVLRECAAKKLRSPLVIDYSQAAAASMMIALSNTQANTSVVYESVYLTSLENGLQTVPTALVSGYLADKLFSTYRPSNHTHTPFGPWVAVYCQAGSSKDEGKGGVVNTQSSASQYDALRCTIAQNALDSRNLNDGKWGGDPTLSTDRITAILFDMRNPSRSRIWLYNRTSTLSTTCQAALKWQRDIRDKTAAQWDPLKPGDRLELCAPVGTKIPARWRSIADYLLRATDDMCCIYQLGPSIRAKAWELGARTYHDLWSKQQTLAELQLSPLTLAMTWTNHRDNPENTVVPRHIKKSVHRALINRTKTKPWFVVDFETIQSNNRPWIFMVATVFVDPSTSPPTYRVFTHRMRVLTVDAQVTMLCAWVDEMRTCIKETLDITNQQETFDSLTATPIFHWSSAEPSFLKRLWIKSPEVGTELAKRCGNTHSLLTTVATKKHTGGLCWCDVYTIFRKEPITIAGCFNFKLKHVVKALVALGKLSDTHLWAVAGPQDGRAAMQQAEYGFETNDDSVFTTIVQYNEADVLVLYSIMTEVLWKMIE